MTNKLYLVVYALQPREYGPVSVKSAYVIADSVANAACAFKETIKGWGANRPSEAYITELQGAVHLRSGPEEEWIELAAWQNWLRTQTSPQHYDGQSTPAAGWRISMAPPTPADADVPAPEQS